MDNHYTNAVNNLEALVNDIKKDMDPSIAVILDYNIFFLKLQPQYVQEQETT